MVNRRDRWMEPNQADRDARVERMLDELDDVEEKIEDLRPAGQLRSMVIVLFLVLAVAAAILAMLLVPSAWDFAPFLIVACAYALAGWRAISAKNEELDDLKQARARLTGEPLA